jgi:ATP-binding cassette, subfamily G (WHITE), member 2, SNQ2
VGLSNVAATEADELALSHLHQTLTGRSDRTGQYPKAHSDFRDFLLEKTTEPYHHPPHKGVCFESITTWGNKSDDDKIKTLGDAIRRTLTFRDIYEWVVKPWLSPDKIDDGRPLISGFSGVVKNGEMML